MFVDLMHDVANTFTERFLKAQLVFDQPPPPPEPYMPPALRGGPGPDTGDGAGRQGNGRPTRRYNAMGILEDVPPEELLEETAAVGPAEQPSPAGATAGEVQKTVAHGSPKVVGAGNVRSLGPDGGGAMPAGWESTPRNNPCPCGSGKKFKKCHGANL